jgi:hypothetical protein
MRASRTLAGIVVVTVVALLVVSAGPAHAQGDLDCGDPGVGVAFRIDPNNDPHQLDADNDGIACEADGSDAVMAGTAGAPASGAAPASSGSGSQLPRTGAAPTLEALLAAALLAVGALARRAAERVRPKHLAR